jgi:hypothetical protein
LLLAVSWLQAGMEVGYSFGSPQIAIVDSQRLQFAAEQRCYSELLADADVAHFLSEAAPAILTLRTSIAQYTVILFQFHELIFQTDALHMAHGTPSKPVQ